MTYKTSLIRIFNLAIILLDKYTRPVFRFLRFRGATEVKKTKGKVCEMKLLSSNFLGKRGDSIFLSQDLVLKYNIYYYGIYERNTISFFRDICHKSQEIYEFIDVGANCGLISRGVALDNENISRVIAIEPISENYLALIANLSATQTNMEIVELGIGKVKGNSNFKLPRNQLGSAMITSDEPILEGDILRRVEIITPTELIENFLATQNRLLIKCDVENKDIEVLNAFPEKFWNRVDGLTFEVHKSTFVTDLEFRELYARLNTAGLKLINGESESQTCEQVVDFISRLKQKSLNLMFARKKSNCVQNVRIVRSSGQCRVRFVVGDRGSDGCFCNTKPVTKGSIQWH